MGFELVDMDSRPLVSVPVITYNSSKYVLETLESIKAQTYQNIELIISDDCSTDNTVEICRDWIEKNKSRFVRTVLLTSSTNTGISANLNRAEDACDGEWVKSIAGDDILLPYCIDSFVEFAAKNKNVFFIFSTISVFGGEHSSEINLEDLINKRIAFFSQLSAEEQYKEILNDKNPPAPGFFYNKDRYRQLGIRNDERIRDMEDWPKWLTITGKGERFYFVMQPLVKYRLGGISTQQKCCSESFFKARRQVYLYYLFDPFYKGDMQKGYDKIIDFECDLYKEYLIQYRFAEKIRNSFFFRIYCFLKKLFAQSTNDISNSSCI